MPTLYDLLGIPPHASTDEIKIAYRARAKVLHPDVGGNADSFQMITEAYEILSDPEKRAHYDATGTIDNASDNSHTEALNIVAQIMTQVLGQVQDIIVNDVVAKMVEAANTEAAKIEAQYTDDDLLRLIRAHGVDESKPAAADAAAETPAGEA